MSCSFIGAPVPGPSISGEGLPLVAEGGQKIAADMRVGRVRGQGLPALAIWASIAVSFPGRERPFEDPWPRFSDQPSLEAVDAARYSFQRIRPEPTPAPPGFREDGGAPRDQDGSESNQGKRGGAPPE